jgi:hypothetical protein
MIVATLTDEDAAGEDPRRAAALALYEPWAGQARLAHGHARSNLRHAVLSAVTGEKPPLTDLRGEAYLEREVARLIKPQFQDAIREGLHRIIRSVREQFPEESE